MTDASVERASVGESPARARARARATRLGGALAFVVMGGAAACFSERVAGPADELCDGSATPCAVQMSDNSFTPATRRVSVGSTVRWTNAGASPHTATSTAWDSGTLMSGQSFERAFPAVGSFDYECIFHSGMTGRIVVE